ncbi:MAG: class B sortase [Bacilli bacterium]|nr:class B sortase [Bacilli bacterium]
MKKLIIPICIFIITLILLIFSGFNLVLWHIDNQKTNSEVELAQSITPVNVITVSDDSKNDSKEETYITADITETKKLNSEIKGWINIPGTNVNHPFVQHKNNSYYLNHSLDRSKNNAGWIFLDYRNNSEELDKNTILYGHNRRNGSMFGSLNKLTKKACLNDSSEHNIYISNRKYNYVFEIFSIYRIETTDDYIKTSFTDDEFADWLELIKNRSIHNFNVDLTKDDKVLTLSTCYENEKKLAIHAKLIRIQPK